MTFHRSMRFQASAILILGFLLSHMAGYLFYKLDRRDVLEMTEAADLAERAAGISRLVRDLPPAWQSDVIRFSDSRTFRVWSSPESALTDPGTSDDELNLVEYLRSQVTRIAGNEMRAKFIGPTDRDLLSKPPELVSRPGASSTATDVFPTVPAVAISIRHDDGEWLNFVGSISTPQSLVPELLLANVISAVFGIGLVAFWLVNRVTAPLARLSGAAEKLGRNLFVDPLPVSGPREVAVSAEAFNRMQARLVRLLESRTELLAGISHDLRTPLTQVRLRLEMMPESRERQKILATLDEMNAIIGTFLSYARAAHESEEKVRVDIGALVSSVCDDLADCGAAVEYDTTPGLPIVCKRLAIKRAVTNLVENALKYGHEARVRTFRTEGWIVVSIEDSGPGLPEREMEGVLRPFSRGVSTRSDGSRSGVGLGLSIAQAVAEDHGGEVRLRNRPTGGLRAEIALPA